MILLLCFTRSTYEKTDVFKSYFTQDGNINAPFMFKIENLVENSFPDFSACLKYKSGLFF